MMIHPIILCGGSGTRLWPFSRKSFPKQFSQLLGDGSLFQQTATRLQGPEFGTPVIVTGADFRFIVADQLADAGIQPAAILIEPEARNTAPAVLAAALWLSRTQPDALLLVAPADHNIKDPDAFQAAIHAAVPAAAAGRIVTFGVVPDRPETGYGYLELASRASLESHGPQPLKRFVEKPDAANAEAMLKAGNYLWNAGIFLFSVNTILEACRRHEPELFEAVESAVSRGVLDLTFTRLDAASWSQAANISIDYAIMEKAENLSVVRLSGAWSDLGDWQSVWAESPKDADGIAALGQVTAIDCHDSVLFSAGGSVELVGIGLEDMIAVAMHDAVLVAPRSRSQDVKLAVGALKQRKARQAEVFPSEHRPWGSFESIATGDRFQVKRIVVRPGGALSMQSHMHRAEHWIVVAGTGEVTINDEVRILSENQSVYVPLGARHRLINNGKVPLIIVEVQTGSYLGEDDITRYEDIYARV